MAHQGKGGHSTSQPRAELRIVLHADVVDSTVLVQIDERIAHERIRDAFGRFSRTIEAYGGTTLELRGDALLAGFSRVSDAVCAALHFQAGETEHRPVKTPEVAPVIRTGISMGEVVIADGTVTGSDVVMAQRVEQLAVPGGICVSQSVFQSAPKRLPVVFEDLGPQELKGFDTPTNVYAVTLADGQQIPEPERPALAASVGAPAGRRQSRRSLWLGIAAVLVLAAIGFFGWQQPQTDFEPAAPSRMAYPLPETPSIAVLPFDNLSGNPDEDHVARGMTESLIAVLAKEPALLVISSNASGAFEGKDVATHEVAERLGVRHVLAGSIQRTGERLRVTARLMDAVTGRTQWTERYDRQFADLFALQDDVIKQILVELQVELTIGEHAKDASRNTESLDAWLLHVQAEAAGFTFTREGFARARRLYQAAHEKDPNWSRPLGGLAWTHQWDARSRWTDDPAKSRETGMALARRAIELDPTDPVGYQILGNLVFDAGNKDEGIALRERAMALAPSNFNVIAGTAALARQGGYPERALELVARAKRLSPIHPWWFIYGEGAALQTLGRNEEAVAAFDAAINLNEGHALSYLRRAASLVSLGREDEGRADVKAAIALNPKIGAAYMRRTNAFEDEATLERLLAALKSAGLPD